MSKRQFHQKSERLPGAPRSGVNRWCGGIEQIFTIAAAGMFAILVSITTTSVSSSSLVNFTIWSCRSVSFAMKTRAFSRYLINRSLN